MWKYSFWKDALERAVKTVAQTLIAYFVVGEGFNAFTANWSDAAGVAAGAAILSFLTSLASTQVGVGGTASLVSEANAPAPRNEV